MAEDLDEQVEAFRSRPLDAGPYVFVAAAALVLKVREGGRVVGVHALLAVGVIPCEREVPAAAWLGAPPTQWGTSPTATPSSVLSARSWPSNTMSGPRAGATSASTSSTDSASPPSPPRR